jgi:hypothetical protein
MYTAFDLHGLRLTGLEVVRRNQARPAVPANHFCFPPPVILQAEDRKNIALCESQLFWDLCCVCVHRASCGRVSIVRPDQTIKQLTVVQNDPAILVVVLWLSKALAAYPRLSSD